MCGHFGQPCIVGIPNTNLCIFGIPFFFDPIYYLRPSFLSHPPSRNSDPGSHSRFFSPPPHYGSCVAFFIARKISALSFADSYSIEWYINHYIVLEYPISTIVSLEHPVSTIVSLEYPISTVVSLNYPISTTVFSNTARGAL